MAFAALWPAIVGYGVGSVPFAWLIVRRMTGLDLRYMGSGNVGAANAMRATRWRTGVFVALLDLAKGSMAVALVALAGGDVAARALGGFAAVAGHVFPLWLRFRGGKGVATACGAFVVLAPLATLLAAMAFGAAVITTRIVSVASLVGSAVLALASWRLASPTPVMMAAIAAASLVTFRHRSNIHRLMKGTERRLTS